VRHALVVSLLVVLSPTAAPARASADATCTDYPNQAAAQRAHDTRDPDHDGIYCESLPCPCSRQSGDRPTPTCVKPTAVAKITFSKTKYPNIRRHFLDALRRGWPRILVLNRPGAAARRDRLLSGYPARSGYDRDEYPPAVGRGRGHGLTSGSKPRGWKADVEYVPSSENRSHGSTLGTKLRRYCEGTRFRYVFY
jgi:hypothetical protein